MSRSQLIIKMGHKSAMNYTGAAAALWWMHRRALAASALLTAGCAPLFGPGDVTVPPPEAVSAAVVSSYPFAVRACLEFGLLPAERVACVATAREALTAALGAYDAAIDAKLAERAPAQEGTVGR
ncbi:hypothetical protein WME98_50070 [Sorangium sp. So ce296]|uniref:hypothetical protein n=1 Tax=Sorangium sp. So ce296 TaxID=3133296 RepID=UPI003F6347B1